MESGLRASTSGGAFFATPGQKTGSVFFGTSELPGQVYALSAHASDGKKRPKSKKGGQRCSRVVFWVGHSATVDAKTATWQTLCRAREAEEEFVAGSLTKAAWERNL